MTLRWSSRRAEVGPLFQWQRHLAPAAGQCCRPASGFRPSFFPFVVNLPKPTSDHLLLGSPFRLPFSGGWMLLQIFIVRMLVSFGKGCVTGGGGDASGCRMRLPPLWTRVQPCLAWPSQPPRRLTFEDWESGHSQPCPFHHHCNALLSFCASASTVF